MAHQDAPQPARPARADPLPLVVDLYRCQDSAHVVFYRCQRLLGGWEESWPENHAISVGLPVLDGGPGPAKRGDIPETRKEHSRET